MVRNSDGLSRHEKLRYDYLLSNLQYLSPKEKEEFDYLYAKKKSGMDAYGAYYETDSDFDSYNQYADDYYGDNDLNSTYDTPNNTEKYTQQGLPRYPRESYSRRSKQASEPPVYVEQYADPIYEEPKASKKPKIKKPQKPRRKIKWKRILLVLALLLLVVIGGMGYMFYRGIHDVTSGNTDYTAAVTETFNGVDAEDGTNILILGSDQRVTQGSSDARTDTIMVANVGNSDGKVKLVSFMRDTLVNINGVSYNDYSYDQKLNVAFNIGEQDNNQGAELMRETLKNNFDIDIKYYVMVDFETFVEAIDTLFPNGVKIDAQFGTVDGEDVSSVEVPDDLNMDENGNVPNQTIKEGVQRMDGRTLLNYARFRKDDDGDYGRTTRQQQVIKAIVEQVKDPTKLFTGSAAIGKVYALTSTNMNFSYLLTNGVSILSDASNGIEQTTIPAEGDWVDEYDMYGGLGLSIDFEKYQEELEELGLR